MVSEVILRECGRKIKCETVESNFYKGLKIEDDKGTIFFLNRDIVLKSWNLDLPLLYCIDSNSVDVVKKHIENWSNNVEARHTVSFKEINNEDDLKDTLFQFIDVENDGRLQILVNLNLKYDCGIDKHYVDFLDDCEVLSDLETYLCYLDICVVPNMVSFKM